MWYLDILCDLEHETHSSVDWMWQAESNSMGGKVNRDQTSKLVVKTVGWRNLKPRT